MVINTISVQKPKKQKLSFSEYIYDIENPNSTFSRADIYGDFGR
jgi:hypothetical protein